LWPVSFRNWLDLAAARLSGTLRFQAGTVWIGHSTASGSKASKHVFHESQAAGRNPQAADRKSLTAAGCWRLRADGRLQHQSTKASLAVRPKGWIPVKNKGILKGTVSKTLGTVESQIAIRKSLTAADCWLLVAGCRLLATCDPRPAADG